MKQQILAYVLTARLTPPLNDIIHPNQTAYMPGQFIGTNIRFIQDVIDHNYQEDSDAIVLFLDFKKVFDSVSHLFLSELLTYIGLPMEFVQWIQLLYNNAISCI